MPRKPRTEEQRAQDAAQAKARRGPDESPHVITAMVRVIEEMRATIQELRVTIQALRVPTFGVGTTSVQPSVHVGTASVHPVSGEPLEGVSPYLSSPGKSQDFCGFAEREESSKTAIRAGNGTDDAMSVPRRYTSVQAAPTYRNGTSEAPTSETRVRGSQPDTPLQDRRAQSSGARDLEELGEAREAGGET